MYKPPKKPMVRAVKGMAIEIGSRDDWLKLKMEVDGLPFRVNSRLLFEVEGIGVRKRE